jgi:GNAT superfamily N-acetyltransferase
MKIECFWVAFTPLTTLRTFEREDVPAVAELMKAHLLRTPLPGGDDASFLLATTIADPWADCELPSLVATDDDGGVVGFVACQPRRMWLGEVPVRGVCISHLVVAPSARLTNAGPQLLRRVLAGPQDLTFSDTASDLVVRLWRVLGGEVDSARRYDWLLVLDGPRWVASVVRAALRERRVRREHLPVAALPLQAAGRRLVKRAFPPSPAGVALRPTDAANFVAGAATAARSFQLRPRYDPEYIETVLARLGSDGGEVVSGLVYDGARVAGAVVYVLHDSVARVLAVLTCPADAGAVLSALVDDARARGAALLTGRSEPTLTDALASRLAVFGAARQPVFHTRSPAVCDALLRSAALTRLDAEWWVT